MKHIKMQLTPKQEQFVLNSILTAKAIDAGASRVVYECSDEVKEHLNLGMERDYVIKLSVGMAGYNQQKAEVTMFEDFGREYLAEIRAIGAFVEIMEKVDILDEELREFSDRIECFEDFCYEEFVDFVDAYSLSLDADYGMVYDTIYFLCEKLGYSGDNGQVGVAYDGRVVAYDYGYDLGDCGTRCTGTTSSVQYQDKYQLYFIGRLYQFLEGKEFVTPAEVKAAANSIEDDLVYIVQMDYAKRDAKERRERIAELQQLYALAKNDFERGLFIGQNMMWFAQDENGNYDFIKVKTREVKRNITIEVSPETCNSTPPGV